jgi:hypothetical protein
VPAVDQLALLSTRGYESSSGGYWYVEGQVKNLSNLSLKNVEAVATWFAKDGSFITSEARAFCSAIVNVKLVRKRRTPQDGDLWTLAYTSGHTVARPFPICDFIDHREQPTAAADEQHEVVPRFGSAQNELLIRRSRLSGTTLDR